MLTWQKKELLHEGSQHNASPSFFLATLTKLFTSNPPSPQGRLLWGSLSCCSRGYSAPLQNVHQRKVIWTTGTCRYIF